MKIQAKEVNRAKNFLIMLKYYKKIGGYIELETF